MCFKAMAQRPGIGLASRQSVSADDRIEEIQQAVGVEQLAGEALFLVRDHGQLYRQRAQRDQGCLHLGKQRLRVPQRSAWNWANASINVSRRRFSSS